MVKLVKNTGMKLIFILSIIATSFCIPSFIFESAIDRMCIACANAIVRITIGAIINGGKT